MDTDRCRELNAAFCRRYLPPHVANGHTLLLDGDGLIPFVPDTTDLHRCLAEYADALEQARRHDPADVLDLRDASEVTLAYVYRGLDAGRPLPDAASRQRLAGLLRRVLADAADAFGPRRWETEMRWYDGFKCLDALACLLETLHEEAEFRRRFLPPRAPDPHALLVDFHRRYDFTPSAAEVQQCLEAYARLVERAGRANCLPIRWCVGATELALAYLSHALQAGTPLADRGTIDRLVGLLRKALADTVALYGVMRWYDGYKRIDLLAWLLEENAPKGMQGWHVLKARLRQALRLG